MATPKKKGGRKEASSVTRLGKRGKNALTVDKINGEKRE